MTDPSDSTRRDFLTGRSARKELLRRATEVGDAILDAGEHRTAPTAGDTVRLETRAMGCAWAVILNPGPPRQVMSASDALQRVHQVEDQLTVYREDSEIARVNQQAAAQPCPVADDLFRFLETCSRLWTETAGVFDPASGALIRCWKQARADGRIPDGPTLEAARERTGFQHVHLDAEQRTIRFDIEGLLLDFGAIGKGEAIDQAVTHLDSEEIENYLVHGGQSSLYARGQHGEQDGWPVGIRNPLFTEDRYATVLLKDEALSTSGSNVQYFRYQGRRYGHILDPRTGWPAEGLLSVTVIAPTAAEADALSTSFYVMGLDRAVAWCDDHPEVGALLVPPPAQGRTLEPVVCNLPAERLFFE